ASLDKIVHAAVESKMVIRRLGARQPLLVRMANLVRSLEVIRYRNIVNNFRRAMVLDRSIYQFCEGRSLSVPILYDYLLDQHLGQYAALLARDERHVLVED